MRRITNDEKVLFGFVTMSFGALLLVHADAVAERVTALIAWFLGR